MAGLLGVTVLDIATEVLSILGVYSPGEAIAAADSAALLFTLGGIVDGYGSEFLTIYNSSVLTFATVGGKQAYTVGPDVGNDWVTAQLPADISGVSAMLGTVEVPLTFYTETQWQSIALKSMGGAGLVSGVWVQRGFPAHTLNFWPVPTTGLSVRLYCALPIPRFTDVTNIVALPPNYQQLLTYELVIKASSTMGAQIPPWVPVAYAEARTRIKEANFTVIDAELDPALSPRGGTDLLGFYTGR